MELRLASQDDAVAIAQVHVDAWRAAYADIMPAAFLATLSVEARAEMWRTSIAAGRLTMMLAWDGDRLAGWIAFGASRDADKSPPLDPDHAWAEVHALNVLPEYWGSGAGLRLMQYALTQLRQAGYAHVTLWTLQENHRARAFYQRLGFEQDGTDKIFQLGELGLKEMRYQYSW